MESIPGLQKSACVLSNEHVTCPHFLTPTYENGREAKPELNEEPIILLRGLHVENNVLRK